MWVLRLYVEMSQKGTALTCRNIWGLNMVKLASTTTWQHPGPIFVYDPTCAMRPVMPIIAKRPLFSSSQEVVGEVSVLPSHPIHSSHPSHPPGSLLSGTGSKCSSRPLDVKKSCGKYVEVGWIHILRKEVYDLYAAIRFFVSVGPGNVPSQSSHNLCQ